MTNISIQKARNESKDLAEKLTIKETEGETTYSLFKVSEDGAWTKRPAKNGSCSSLVGWISVIDVNTNKVIDYGMKTCVCLICKLAEKKILVRN